MSQQIKKKFIEANAIDGSKLQLLNDEALRIKKLGGLDQEVFKLDVTDKLQFLISPRVSVDPTDSDELARKGYVDQKIADLVASAPAVLDTLKELADAIGDDPNFATTVAGQVAGVQSNLNSEINRAVTAEAGLQSDINAEETRALAAEGVLQSNIDTEQAARVAEDLTFVKLDGSRPMSGDMDMAEHSILNVPSISDSTQVTITGASGESAYSTLDLQSAQMELKGINTVTGVESYFGAYSMDSNQPQMIYDLYNPNSGDDAWIYLNLDEDAGAQNASIDAGAYSSLAGTSSTLNIDGANGTTILSGSTSLQVQQAGVNVSGNLTVQPGSTISLSGNVLGSVGSGSLATDAVNKGQLDAAISSVSSGGSVALAQEIADRIADVDAEEARAMGVEASLQSQITQEITDRQSDVNAEETRALAAEAALGSRLDILEGDATVVGSVAKAEADAKAYTDTEIAALVNGAPALLDTLNELAAAINNDESFAVTITNSIASVQSNLTQEISDRIADVNAEESRAMGVEASLQSQITQEVSDRQADVNAEETRAMGVEASLQSQITQEISDRQADVTAEETRAMAAESALDARVVALEGVAVQFASEKFTLSAGDISNGYVTLGHVAVAGSMNAFVDRLAIFETDDYTLSTVSGVTRVTFVGSLVTPGQEKLSSGDVVRVKYAYEVL